MARKPEPLIRRIDHNYFHGWAVAIKRGGHRQSKYFSDRPGGRAAALRRARSYRDALVTILPPPVKVKTKLVTNTTGVVGVALVRERSRAGTPTDRYVAFLPNADRTRGKRSFSLAKYGKQRAFDLAVAARRRAVRELIIARKKAME